MTNRQTNRQTDGHGDSMTNSAKRAELVKTNRGRFLTPIKKPKKKLRKVLDA